MKNDTVRVTVTKVERTGHSRNGGPKFRVYWKFSKQTGFSNTKPDAQISYFLTGMESGEWDITVNGRNQIVDMVKV